MIFAVLFLLLTSPFALYGAQEVKPVEKHPPKPAKSVAKLSVQEAIESIKITKSLETSQNQSLRRKYPINSMERPGAPVNRLPGVSSPSYLPPQQKAFFDKLGTPTLRTQFTSLSNQQREHVVDLAKKEHPKTKKPLYSPIQSITQGRSYKTDSYIPPYVPQLHIPDAPEQE